uniref:NAD(P)/FAD-dependent oxidoreductase n=1 Tax=Crenothrix polyspora TaxID=360316 RepID=UPI0015C5D15B
MPNNGEVHKIVIVGGGAAGLELVTSLGKKLGKQGLAEITLLDATATHIWKPLLHEVAAGTLDESEQVDYLAQGYRNHFRFRLGKMEGLNRQKKEIYVSATINAEGEQIIPKRTISYDTLVMAVGSVSNTFNVKGVVEHCMFLDTTTQAFKFQKHLLETYIKNYVGNEGKLVKPLSIAIIGAGATGVELSAQLHEVTNVLATYGLRDANDVKLCIVEAATQLLPALPARLALATQRQLVALGIDLKLGRRVVEITPAAIVTHDGDYITADLKVWA